MTQSTHAQNEDTLCFKIDVVRELYKDAKAFVICDSMLQNRNEAIVLLEEKIVIQEQQKEALIELSTQQHEEIEALRHDLDRAERKNKFLKIFSGAAAGVIAVETIILILIK